MTQSKTVYRDEITQGQDMNTGNKYKPNQPTPVTGRCESRAGCDKDNEEADRQTLRYDGHVKEK